MSNLYPLKFNDILKDKIWGGRNLEKVLNKQLPPNLPVGESWEISDHGDDTSVVNNGVLKGKSLHQVMLELDKDLLGTEVKQKMQVGIFPLLVKFIDASDRLSIQVHPNDEYAAAHEGEGELGKTESWYIIHAEPNSKLIVGVKEGTTPERFKQGIESNSLGEYVQEVPVSAGDVIFIPSGRLHAIMEGIVLCEIQQNSDTTYRVYDWGRMGSDGTPRDLHITQSLDVIDFNYIPNPKTEPVTVSQGKNKVTYLVACPYFSIEKLSLQETWSGECDGRHFICLSGIQGKAEIKYDHGSIALHRGESCLLPAAMGKFEIAPEESCEIIRSYVPDIAQDIKTPLKENGISAEKIEKMLFE